MNDRIIARLLTRLEARGPGDGRHSQVYRIMRARHASLTAKFEAGWIGWEAVAQEMAGIGVSGKRGTAPPSADSLRRVWKRVCRDVEAEAMKLAAQPPKRLPPSRMSPDWRPTVVAPLPPPPPPIRRQLPAPLADGGSLGTGTVSPEDDGFTEEEKQRIAEGQAVIDALLDEHDKKFRF